MKPLKCPYYLALLLIGIFAMGSVAEATWKEKVLYSFQGGTDGSTPAGGVVFDAAGNLYGTTQQGGGTTCAPISFCGTVFQLTKKSGSWTETVLHVFAGVTGNNDGATPAGGLVIDAAGNLFASTAYGGSGGCVLVGIKGGCGTVYELSPPKVKGGKWTYAILYSFQGGKDGYFPWGDLVFDAAGNLYGATQFGGGFGSCDSPFYQFCGTVFELSPPKVKGGLWKEKVLYSFRGVKAGKQFGDGANPNGGLTLDSTGAIYGTTRHGGYNANNCTLSNEFVGCGTAFELEPPSKKGGPWLEKLLYSFKGYPGDGAGPNDGMAFGADDKSLYGTTVGGGSAAEGVLFRIAATGGGGWTEAILTTFQGGHEAAAPMGGVVFNSSRNLYGTTCLGGPVGDGVLYELNHSQEQNTAWTYATLYPFKAPPDGACPAGSLTVDKAGEVYGTTQQGGSTGQFCGNQGCGIVFKAMP
jgi:uncharacterized repeat protein (TIGR03803 family)